MSRPAILTLGGELLDAAGALNAIAHTIASIARCVPLVVIERTGLEA